MINIFCFLKKIEIFNSVEEFLKYYKKKIDYTMSSIIGLDGLEPTLQIIKKTKNIAIANKESIICGWHLIKSELKKHNTNFFPVDSEHFSLMELIKKMINLKLKKFILLHLEVLF